MSGNGVVTAVASRDESRSKRFIEECHATAPMPTIPGAFGSYEELIASPDVDAIYNPLPTGLRKEWLLRAAAAGKHILCEKPCAVSASDLREVLEACARHKVQFMDGVMFMHNGRMPQMRAVLDDPANIGAIRRIATSFTFQASEGFFDTNIRAQHALEPAGCLGDLGWYCIRFTLWAMRWQMPRKVVGRILKSIPGANGPQVPTEFSAELFFENDVSATLYCSFLTAAEQQATISGTTGYLRVSDFVLPFPGPEIRIEINQAQQLGKSGQSPWKTFSVAEQGEGHPTAQETKLFRNFAKLVQSGRIDPHWSEIALKTQQVMDACLASALNGSAETDVR